MAALHRACFPICLVLLTLGGFASANRHLKESPNHETMEALKNLQGSGSAGVSHTYGGVLVGFPGITIPGVSVGAPGVSISIPGVSIGMPGVSVGIPGISIGGGPGVVYGPSCPLYIPGYGCAYSAVPLHAVSGKTSQQEAGKDHKMVPN